MIDQPEIKERRPVAFRRSESSGRIFHFVPDELHRLTLRAAVGPDDRAQQDLATWEQHIDLDTGLDAGTYRLLPLIAERIERLGLVGDHSGRIAGTAKMAWVQNKQLLFGARPAVQTLVEAGIDVTLLKGAALAQLDRLPGNHVRPMADVDLLVAAENAPAALRMLTTSGWVQHSDVKPSFVRWRHSIGLARAVSKTDVDLHWRTAVYPPPARWAAWLTADDRPGSLGGVPVRIPAPDRLLAHALQHGAVSNPESPIRWAADAHLLATFYRSDIDWESIAEFAVEIRMNRRFAVCLRWLQEHLETAVPERVFTILGSRTSLLERIETRSDRGHYRLPARVAEFAAVWIRAEAGEEWTAAMGTQPHFLRDRWGVARRRDLPVAAWQRTFGARS